MAKFITRRLSGPESVRAGYFDWPPDFSNQIKSGQMVADSDIPKEVYLKAPRKKIADYWMIPDGIPIVSQKFKELIEKYEPTKKRFHPLQVHKTKTGPIFDEAFFVCQLLEPVDAIVPESSKGISINSELFTFPLGSTLAIRHSAISGRNIWVDRRQRIVAGFFVSDDFLQEIINTGILGVEEENSIIEV